MADVMASSPVHILHVLLCVCLLKASSTEWMTLFVSVPVGDTVTIQCRPRHEPHHDGVYVKTFLFKEEDVSYFFHKGDFTPESPYTGRLNSNKNISNFILYINNVTMKDSGIYWCAFNKEDKVSLSMERYLLVVSGIPVSRWTGKFSCNSHHCVCGDCLFHGPVDHHHHSGLGDSKGEAMLQEWKLQPHSTAFWFRINTLSATFKL
ncbi:uncharacterized protein LOC143521912 isoform X2 [Brachyhypopomus gauderio]|uniref:uncharacterized protein LOC143521912 isoform X2 n=1 Tax=Brachyhypopomus gauderio TaxID=698409 RepID=UPI0040424127